jgi:UDP-N-acetylglucosamine 2-epimerase
VKIAPIVAELHTRPEAITTLIHTGQHYDAPMSDAFFANLLVEDETRRVGPRVSLGGSPGPAHQGIGAG